MTSKQDLCTVTECVGPGRRVVRWRNPRFYQRHHDGTFTWRGRETAQRSAMHAAYHRRHR